MQVQKVYKRSLCHIPVCPSKLVLCLLWTRTRLRQPACLLNFFRGGNQLKRITIGLSFLNYHHRQGIRLRLLLVHSRPTACPSVSQWSSNTSTFFGIFKNLKCSIFFVVYCVNKPILVAVRSTAWVFGRSLAGIVGSNPAGGMDVCLLWVLCVVR